jgi:hypothetical protein
VAKRSKPPALHVITSGSDATIQPAAKLGPHGLALWDGIMSEYEINDAPGIQLLLQAAHAADRADTLREQINRDGAVLRRGASIRAHPLLAHELAARSFVVRTLGKLGLNFEPVRSVGRPSSEFGWKS